MGLPASLSLRPWASFTTFTFTNHSRGYVFYQPHCPHVILLKYWLQCLCFVWCSDAIEKLSIFKHIERRPMAWPCILTIGTSLSIRIVGYKAVSHPLCVYWSMENAKKQQSNNIPAMFLYGDYSEKAVFVYSSFRAPETPCWLARTVYDLVRATMFVWRWT